MLVPLNLTYHPSNFDMKVHSSSLPRHFYVTISYILSVCEMNPQKIICKHTETNAKNSHHDIHFFADSLDGVSIKHRLNPFTDAESQVQYDFLVFKSQNQLEWAHVGSHLNAVSLNQSLKLILKFVYHKWQ